MLALIFAFLFPSSLCTVFENVAVLCFAPRNRRFTLILFFWCLAVSGGWLVGAKGLIFEQDPPWEGL